MFILYTLLIFSHLTRMMIIAILLCIIPSLRSIFCGMRVDEKCIEGWDSFSYPGWKASILWFQIQVVFSTYLYLRCRCSEFKGLDKPWILRRTKILLEAIAGRTLNLLPNISWMFYQQKLCCFLIFLTLIISIYIFSLKQFSRFHYFVALRTIKTSEIRNEHSNLIR